MLSTKSSLTSFSIQLKKYHIYFLESNETKKQRIENI